MFWPEWAGPAQPGKPGNWPSDQVGASDMGVAESCSGMGVVLVVTCSRRGWQEVADGWRAVAGVAGSQC